MYLLPLASQMCTPSPRTIVGTGVRVVGRVPGEVHPEMVLGGALAGLVGLRVGHGACTSVSRSIRRAPVCPPDRGLANDSRVMRVFTDGFVARSRVRPTDSVVDVTTLAPWLTPPSAMSSTESSSTPRRGRRTTSSTRPPGRSTRPRRCRARRTSTAPTEPPRRPSRQWGRMTPEDRAAALLKIADARRRARRGDQRGRVQGHRQAARPDHVGGDALRLRPLPVLRRRQPGARGSRRRGSTWRTTPPTYAASRSASSDR